MPKRKRCYTRKRKRLSGYRRKRAIARYRRKRYMRRKYKGPGRYQNGMSEEQFPYKFARINYFNTTTMVTGANTVPVTMGVAAANCYEPRLGGHQPILAQSLGVSYSNYIVTGAKISIRFMNDQATASFSGRFMGVYCNRGNTNTITNCTKMVERKQGQCILRGVGYNNRDPTVRAYYCPRKLFGIRDIRDAQESLGCDSTGVNTATPSTKPFFFAIFQNTTSNVVTVRIGYWVSYTVLYYNPTLEVA